MSESSPTRWLVFTAADPTVERIFPKLAKEIGLNESILLMQIAYWISISKHVKEGVYWTYHSVRELHKNYFPYWSTATIWRTINNLKDSGYIIVGEFNDRKGDNTQWFALEPDKLSTLKSIVIMPEHSPSQVDTPFQNETPLFQNETTIPETTTDIKNTIAPDGAGASQSKTSKPREPNPMYDAIKDIWGYTATMNGAMAKMLTGIATAKGWKEYNLETPITPDGLRQWAKWYRETALKDDENLNMLEERIKIQSSITKWQETHQTVGDDGEPVTAAYTIGSDDDPFKDEIID